MHTRLVVLGAGVLGIAGGEFGGQREAKEHGSKKEKFPSHVRLIWRMYGPRKSGASLPAIKNRAV
jgi:hypothetical protein